MSDDVNPQTCSTRYIVESLADPVQDARMPCAKPAGHLGRHRNAEGSIAWDPGAEMSIRHQPTDTERRIERVLAADGTLLDVGRGQPLTPGEQQRLMVALVADVRAAALAPIQALANEWDRELRSTFKDPDSEVARGYTHKHSDAVRAALAAAGVDAAPNETTTEARAKGWSEGVAWVLVDLGHENDEALAEAIELSNPYRAAVPSGHEQEGENRG